MDSIQRQPIRLALVGAVSSAAFIASENLYATALPWIVWDAPASYGSSGSAIGGDSLTYTYNYAGGTTGTMTLADSSVIYVRFTGEVVDPTLDGTFNPTGGGFCGPSGFSQNGTTISNFWSQLPNTDGNTFTSANVPTVPTNGDHIGLIGGTGGIQTQTVEFFSDAAMTTATSVSDIVLLVASLGGGPNTGSWTFNQDFTILSDNTGVGSGSGLTKTTPTAGSYVLSGQEGSGAIQFTGAVSSFSWTVSGPEVWTSWNLGGTATAASTAAVPGTGLAAIGTLGLAGVARRRRR